MSQLLNRFSIDAVKFNPAVFFFMVIIWLAVVGCAISSVMSKPWNKGQRAFWIFWIVCLPGVGLLSYLPFSMSVDRPTTVFSKKSHKK